MRHFFRLLQALFHPISSELVPTIASNDKNSISRVKERRKKLSCHILLQFAEDRERHLNREIIFDVNIFLYYESRMFCKNTSASLDFSSRKGKTFFSKENCLVLRKILNAKMRLRRGEKLK
jgi:hypothetical protein